MSDNGRLDPTRALRLLADELRDEEVIAPHVVEPREEPALGPLVAAGPRASEAPGSYGVLFEAIREGFLLHYGEARLVRGADEDLRLLAGDYLYALGLERLAARGDIDAVRELADLISLSAQLHARGGDGAADDLIDLLWLSSAVAVGVGSTPGHEEAKRALRRGDGEGRALLSAATAQAAESGGMRAALAEAADSIGFPPQDLIDRG